MKIPSYTTQKRKKNISKKSNFHLLPCNFPSLGGDVNPFPSQSPFQEKTDRGGGHPVTLSLPLHRSPGCLAVPAEAVGVWLPLSGPYQP